MISFSAISIVSDEVASAEVNATGCMAIDNATIAAKDEGTGIVPLSEVRCSMTVTHVLLLQLADDMFVPLPACTVHFNAFRLGISDHTVVFENTLFKD
jgi:hypothetical protein